MTIKNYKHRGKAEIWKSLYITAQHEKVELGRVCMEKKESAANRILGGYRDKRLIVDALL